ncbi:MAG TPA: phosphoribosyltransferase family protein [Solirubrobacteraceae bacterium]
MIFADRCEAGRALGARLSEEGIESDVLVLGLPRGGVPVAREVAAALGAPLDVLLVRKLGVPGHEELAMGAIAPGGVRVTNRDVVEALGLDEATLDAAERSERDELERRDRAYRADRPPLAVAGRTVVVVDDGLATGSTMRAAVQSLRALGAERIVVAVPVGAAQTCARLREDADEIVCLRAVRRLQSVGSWYADFRQTSDDEVREALA